MTVQHFDWLSHHANRTPNKLAWVDLHSDRPFTYVQAEERSARLAFHLQKELGVERGDRVGILCMNSTDMLEVQFACTKIGAIFLPLNWRLTVSELAFIVGDAAPKVMVHDKQFAEEIAQLKKEPGIAHSLETTGGGDASAYEAAISAAKPEPDLEEMDPVFITLIGENLDR